MALSKQERFKIMETYDRRAIQASPDLSSGDEHTGF